MTGAARSMPAGRRQLYIYYRLDPARADAALADVARAQQALRQAWPALRARLLRRELPGGPLTVMEVYATDARLQPEGVDPALQQAIESRLGDVTAAWPAPPQRHLEVFDEVSCVS